MRKRFVLEIVLLAALAGTGLPATAQLREQRIFPAESLATPGELIHLSDGGYLVTVSTADLSQPNQWQRRNVVLRMDDSLRISRQFDAPPGFTAIRPFGDHYVGQSLQDYEHRHLAVFDARGNIVRTLYENDERIADLDFVTAENDNVVYALETLFNYHFRLHRFTADGTHEWRQDFTNQLALELVATGDGVALYVEPYNPPSPTTIMAISAAGKPRRSTALQRDPLTTGYEFVALPDRVAIRRFFGDARRPRLKVLNAADGTEVADVDTPSVKAMRATARGFLLHGHLAGYPYLALLDKNGKSQWWRRFRFKDNWGVLTDADIASSGKLVLLGRDVQERRLYEDLSATVLIEADVDGTELTKAYGRCLAADPARIDDLQRELTLHDGVTVTTEPQGNERGRPRNDECSAPTDRDHLAFLQDLANSPLLRERFRPLDVGFHVQLDARDPGAQLRMYDFNNAATHRPRTILAFRVGPGEAALLQRRLVEEVQPHLAIMQRRTTRFMELTGYQFAVRLLDNAWISDPALFSKLENTAARVLEIIVALPPAQLESMRSQRRADVYPHLLPGAFGPHNDLRPVDAAVGTLNEMIAKGLEILPPRN